MERYLNKLDEIDEVLANEKILFAKEKVQELKKIIIYDMAMKNANCDKKEQLRSAKQLLNHSIKRKNRELFHKIYKVDDTYQITDGFVVAVLNDMIDGLELSEMEGTFDCREAIEKYNPTGNEYEKVEIDMVELERKAIIVKRAKEDTLSLDDEVHINNLCFDPVYLLRAIKILGKKDVELYVHVSETKYPMYLKSSLGIGMVFPIKHADANN